MANYLSARDYFKAGHMDQGVQELMAASGKSQFQDYTFSRWQDDEEAYLAAGYSIAEAKVIGSEQVELPQLAELKQLGLQMVELSNSYRQAGDAASAQTVLQIAVGLGKAIPPVTRPSATWSAWPLSGRSTNTPARTSPNKICHFCGNGSDHSKLSAKRLDPWSASGVALT